MVVVVLSGTLIESARSDDVVPDDASKGIGEVEKFTLRVRWVRAAIESGDTGGRVKGDSWNLVRQVLPLRKEVRKVDTVFCAIVGSCRRVDAQPCCVVTSREQNLIGHLLIEGMDIVERPGLVRPAVETRHIAIVRGGEWVVLVIIKVDQAETNVVFFRRHDVQIAAVDLLLFRIGPGGQQIRTAEAEVWRWVRKRGEESNAVCTQL